MFQKSRSNSADEESLKDFHVFFISEKMQNILKSPQIWYSLLSSVFSDMKWVLDMVGVQDRKDI